MPYLKSFMSQYFMGTPACRMLALVLDSGRCPVEDFMKELEGNQGPPYEFRSLALVLKKAMEIGPQNIHDEQLCKPVGGGGSRVFEFKAKRGLARVYWFYGSAQSHRPGPATVILVSGSCAKGSKQNDVIREARRIRQDYLAGKYNLVHDDGKESTL